MAEVAACYLYPIKGMTCAPADYLDLEAGSTARGDRAFVFAFADADVGPDGWVSKHEALTLVNTPQLASITASYSTEARRLVLAAPKHGEVSGSIDDPGERRVLADWLTEVVLGFEKHPLAVRTTRLPLQLLGDGTARFADRHAEQISLGAEESARALSERAGRDVALSRFRLNLAVRGLEPWGEFAWAGQRLAIGEAELHVTAPLKRCKAVNASPHGGGRDIPVLDLLQSAYGHLDFGVEAAVRRGGRIKPGDPITVLD
ncbi:MAG: MOSC domain-containing protein [Chloroflexi bacterium]|nr:MOSC domain-containing protein [Chloroflexota bacterium]